MSDQPSQPQPSGRQPGSPRRSGASPKVHRLEASASRGKQCLVNLGIWASFLMGANKRDRMVSYWARDNRSGLKWTVSLPRICWQCGSKEELQCCTYLDTIRSFRNPLLIIFGTLFFVTLFAMLGFFWTTSFIFALVALVMGTALLFFQSWIEDIELSMWSCRSHNYEVETPFLATDDERLFIILPTELLAEAAFDALKKEYRKKGDVGGPDEGESSSARESKPTSKTSKSSSKARGESNGKGNKEEKEELFPTFKPRTTPDLPPIKLVDDEEEGPYMA